MRFWHKDYKAEPKTKEPEAMKPFEVTANIFDYVEKRMKFSEQFLIEAIRERAAREGVLIPADAAAHWSGLRQGPYFYGHFTPSASLEWKEAIPTKTNLTTS